MHLLLHLIGRLVAVVLLCLAAAMAWVMVDAHRSIEADTAATPETMETCRHASRSAASGAAAAITKPASLSRSVR